MYTTLGHYRTGASGKPVPSIKKKYKTKMGARALQEEPHRTVQISFQRQYLLLERV